MEIRRWQVTSLISYLQSLLEIDYRLQNLEVEGEISNFRVPQSGHAYFTLKDARSQMKTVMWASDLNRLDYTPSEGDKVIVEGHVGIYERTGQLQLYCRSMQLAGLGDLYQQFELLKKQLLEEGIFAESLKKHIPDWPLNLGIITSATGAALQDVLSVLQRRAPFLEVRLFPVPVQGEGASKKILRELEHLNSQEDIDICLIVRGGGSIEDLWAFNDPDLARSVALSRVPVISGVGHEIDYTLVDFAADVRAPTPSAAAELAVRNTFTDIRKVIIQITQTLDTFIFSRFDEVVDNLDSLRNMLHRYSPDNLIFDESAVLSDHSHRLNLAMNNQLRHLGSRLNSARKILDVVNPQNILKRGYALVMNETGEIVKSSQHVSPDDELFIRLGEGSLDVNVLKANRDD